MQGPNPSKISRPGSLASHSPFGHLPFHLIFYFTLPYFNLLQHYVVNLSINEQLASVARVEDGECVLEIGPGTGALTQVLDAGATVLAVEKVRQQSSYSSSIQQVTK